MHYWVSKRNKIYTKALSHFLVSIFGKKIKYQLNKMSTLKKKELLKLINNLLLSQSWFIYSMVIIFGVTLASMKFPHRSYRKIKLEKMGDIIHFGMYSKNKLGNDLLVFLYWSHHLFINLHVLLNQIKFAYKWPWLCSIYIKSFN